MNLNEVSELLFGTGGVPVSAQSRSTEDGIGRIAELGLGCMEVEFVQGVKMSPKVATSPGSLTVRRAKSSILCFLIRICNMRSYLKP